MQFNRKATLKVIKTIGKFGKVIQKYGELTTAIGKTTNKLFGNEDFQVELTNSCELVFNTARDRVFGLIDHYKDDVMEDVQEVMSKMKEYEEACENVEPKESEEDLQ